MTELCENCGGGCPHCEKKGPSAAQVATALLDAGVGVRILTTEGSEIRIIPPTSANTRWTVCYEKRGFGHVFGYGSKVALDDLRAGIRVAVLDDLGDTTMEAWIGHAESVRSQADEWREVWHP